MKTVLASLMWSFPSFGERPFVTPFHTDHKNQSGYSRKILNVMINCTEIAKSTSHND